VSTVCHTLRQLYVQSETDHDTTIIVLVDAPVISCINYCNAVLAGVNGVHLRQYNGVLNAAIGGAARGGSMGPDPQASNRTTHLRESGDFVRWRYEGAAVNRPCMPSCTESLHESCMAETTY